MTIETDINFAEAVQKFRNDDTIAGNMKELAAAVSFDVEDMKRYQKLKPVQDKLDKANRGIYVVAYTNVKSPAEFMCKSCEHRWKVKRAKYVTQQIRGCPSCSVSGPKKK